ncbi:MAG: methyl-accepting chemotaxis protein [Marinagarivorans sp.]
MQWLYGLTLKNKLLLPIIVITGLSAALGAITLVQLASIDQHIKLLGRVNLTAANDLLEADSEVHKVLAQERSLLFLNPESAEFIQAAEAHEKSLAAAREKLRAFRTAVPDAELTAEYNAYGVAAERWEQLTKNVVTARTTNTREGRTTAIEISFKDGNQAFNEMRQHIYALKDMINKRSDALMLASEQAVVHTRFLVGFLLAVCTLIAMAMALFIPKFIVAPILNMRQFIARLINDDGDLSQRIPVGFQDELGNLGATINEFIGSLRDLIARVIRLGSVFHQQSKTLKELAQQNSSLVNRETTEIAQVMGSITTLSQSVQNVAQLALEAANKTSLALTESDNGLNVVARTVTGINQLAEKVKNSSDVITQLNSDSANIIGVVNVIRGIADQINLLALNAAIEAARAGEQGRGFAVVADSVRELAFRTAESTQEIQVMISKLQQSAHQAVEAMTQSQSIAEQSVTQAGETGAALNQIDVSVKRISAVNDQIASSANQQSMVAEHISQNSINISQYAEDGAQLASNVAEASDQLERVAAELDKALRKFKTS